VFPPRWRAGNYKNFDVAIYSRVYETKQMKDPAWLESYWEAISRSCQWPKPHVDFPLPLPGRAMSYEACMYMSVSIFTPKSFLDAQRHPAG